MSNREVGQILDDPFDILSLFKRVWLGSQVLFRRNENFIFEDGTHISMVTLPFSCIQTQKLGCEILLQTRHINHKPILDVTLE